MTNKSLKAYNNMINNLWESVGKKEMINLNATKKNISFLESENKNLKEDFKRHIDRINELTNRIDKAIEYIENYLPYLEMVDYEYEDMNGDTQYKMKEWEGKELLDILKGSDNND